MTKNDLSELLIRLLQQLTQGNGVDIRHDLMLSLKDVTVRLDISKPTVLKAIRSGDFPKPIKVAGQDRWPSSVINDYLRQSNTQLQDKNELMAQAAMALKGEQP